MSIDLLEAVCSPLELSSYSSIRLTQRKGRWLVIDFQSIIILPVVQLSLASFEVTNRFCSCHSESFGGTQDRLREESFWVAVRLTVAAPKRYAHGSK